MRVTPIVTASYRNCTGVRRNSAPAVSCNENILSFGAKGNGSSKTWPKILLAVMLVLPLIALPFMSKNNVND